MRFVTDLSKGVLGQPDSEELWSDIIAHIPDEILLKPGVRILSVACGHCTEARLIAQRMLALGISKEAVRESIWLIDKYQQFTNDAVKRYGFKNVVQQDFLTWKPGMKFDVVVGNPPYQNKEENADGALWLRFVNKGLTHLHTNGKLVFITPTSWVGKQTNTKKADWSPFVKYHVEVYKPLSKSEKEKYFNGIGSSFGYYVLSHGHGPTKVLFENGEYATHTLIALEPLPATLTQTSFSIHKKLAKEEKIQFRSNFKFHSQVLKKKGMVSPTRDDQFAFTTYYSHNLVRYTTEQQDIYSEIKVMVPNVGTLANAWLDTDCNLTEDIVFVCAQDVATGQRLVSLLRSTLYQYIGAQYRSGRNLGLAIRFLPKVDLTRTWTDQELYQHFGLTEEEINFIEANVK
ncbi:MAG: Eco57I restriction-modification methylase domain-containing protein [Porticoccaceae bacterium]